MVKDQENIAQLIKNPQIIKLKEIELLDKLTLKYPFFQSGQILLAKGLHKTDNIRFSSQLKKAAAYCLNRFKLYELIVQNTKSEKLSLLKNQESEMEDYTFSEWLKLVKIKKIHRTEIKKNNLVEKFMQHETQIIKPKKETFFRPVDIAKTSLIENTELITPTLARVYMQQGHYEKAYSAYKKLILKFPEKSSFFAEKIKKIKKLNNK